MVRSHGNRRSIRLKGYDYTQAGAYFVTICTHAGLCMFGEIVNGEMRLNEYGKNVAESWEQIPAHFQNVALDESIVMPNHVHGIIVISGSISEPVGATHASPLPNPIPKRSGPVQHSVASIVGSFKSAVTKRINELRGTPGAPVWQRNYYEHIIRTEPELDRIRRYIADNPQQWDLDHENPNRTGGQAGRPNQP